MATKAPVEDEDAIPQEEAAFDDDVEKLVNRRSATREAGLYNICLTLLTRCCSDFLESRAETVVDQVCSLIRTSSERGSWETAAHGAKALSYLAITMGRNQTAYAILSKALVDLSNAHHVPDPTAAAALSSLATSCFFTSTEPHDTVEVMRLLESHFSRTSPAAVSTLPADDDETEITPTTDSDDITDDESTSTHRTTTSRTHSTSSDSEEEEDTDDSAEGTFHARSSHCHSGSRSTCSAVSGWSLLLTSLSLSMIPRIISENSEALLTLLEHPDVDVRIQTGHAFALLFSLLRDSTDESEPFDINDCNDFFDTASFMATVEALCDAQPLPSGLRFSKRDKNKQAPMFRQICRFIQEGIEPTEKMTIKFHPLVFTGWPQVTQLSTLRETLTTGFALHMEKNTILHQLFDLRLDPHKSREKLSHVEKRRFKSGNSERAKARTQKRNIDRDVCVAKKHYQDDSHI